MNRPAAERQAGRQPEPAPAASIPPERRLAGITVVAGRLARRLARRALVAALACTALPGLAASEADIAHSLEEATAAIQQGRHAQALSRASEVLAAQPGHVAARFIRASALAAQGDESEAERIYRALILEYPELPEPHNNLAVLLAARGRLDEARSELETAVAVAPGFALALENLGDVHARLALAAYQHAAAERSTAGLQAKLRQVQTLIEQSRPAAVPPPAASPSRPDRRRTVN